MRNIAFKQQAKVAVEKRRSEQEAAAKAVNLANLFEQLSAGKVKELAEALVLGGRLRPGPEGLELAPGTELPIPDTLRDAVLLRQLAVNLVTNAVEAAAPDGEVTTPTAAG